MHVPRHNRIQYCASVGFPNWHEVSEHWQSHPKISVRNPCSPWEVCESFLWHNKQPHKRQEKVRTVIKKPRSLASIPPTRAALVNHAKRAVFQDGFVWPQTPLEGASVTMSFSGGWQPAGSVWVYLTGQLFNEWTIHVLKSSTAGVKQCVEDIVGVLKEIWHELLLGLSSRNK